LVRAKSLSHNVINAGSFSGAIVHPEYAPHGAERWRGGDGWERVRAEAHADDLADPGRALVHRAHGAAGRGVAPVAGRPWIESRRVLDGVLYVLRTGCQWKAVPAEYGSGSTVHRRFQ